MRVQDVEGSEQVGSEDRIVFDSGSSNNIESVRLSALAQVSLEGGISGSSVQRAVADDFSVGALHIHT